MSAPETPGDAEERRLEEDAATRGSWRRWGTYLSERQWGTVREDYSASGDAWGYFPHAHARSRAYRWGEDGIAGFSDEYQRLCFAIALWNERDPFLKERLFGLSNAEGNHGEDVKELYYYLDATPTCSYARMLYKYPQAPFPYERLRTENLRRDRSLREVELTDLDVLDHGYFDVFVEYAKAAPEDILIRVTVENRGPSAARLHLLPHLWFHNFWSWKTGSAKPLLARSGPRRLVADHPELGPRHLHLGFDAELWFTENESNPALFGEPRPGYFKDAFHRRLVDGARDAVNPASVGTKACAAVAMELDPDASRTFCLRLAPAPLRAPFDDFEAIFAERLSEADDFYDKIQTDLVDLDARRVQRQAFAGMIWSKQYYYYDVPEWLAGDPAQPPPPAVRLQGRNNEWSHLNNADIISMPDKWEYPWYAAWDLAFHTVPLAMIDPAFAKAQLLLFTREWYMHPNGQLPAYEWALGDVNPPVHAWATWRVFQLDRKRTGGDGDLAFLERVFHKLLINFTWWVNKKDAQGRNVFQGGFLGLDNVGVFDRSSPLPTGGQIDQADGTAWMGMYCLNLLRISLELALHNPVYQDIATKFFEHFLHIAEAMTRIGDRVGLWDPEDEFFYDVLNLPDGTVVPLKVRSTVGLIPLFAVETLEPELMARLPEFAQRMEWFLDYRPDLAKLVSRWNEEGRGHRRLLSLLRGSRMKRLLKRMLDPEEFLSDYGVRSLSRVHASRPYHFEAGGQDFEVRYQPAESDSGLFGGNSNWRGPIWFPINYLLIESLQKFHHYYGDDFKVEHPTRSGRLQTIEQVAEDLGGRLTKLFLSDDRGFRPAMAGLGKWAADPHFRDYLLFHEYFDGDRGRGLGAAHQTGWTGLVAKLLQPRRRDSDG